MPNSVCSPLRKTSSAGAGTPPPPGGKHLRSASSRSGSNICASGRIRRRWAAFQLLECGIGASVAGYGRGPAPQRWEAARAILR